MTPLRTPRYEVYSRIGSSFLLWPHRAVRHLSESRFFSSFPFCCPAALFSCRGISIEIEHLPAFSDFLVPLGHFNCPFSSPFLTALLASMNHFIFAGPHLPRTSPPPCVDLRFFPPLLMRPASGLFFSRGLGGAPPLFNAGSRSALPLARRA